MKIMSMIKFLFFRKQSVYFYIGNIWLISSHFFFMQNSIADNTATEDVVFINISSSHDVFQYALTGNSSVTLVFSDGNDDKEKIIPYMIYILKKQNFYKGGELELAAKDNRDKIPNNVKWVSFSPDKKYALYGFEERPLNHRVSVTLEHLSDHSILYELKNQKSIIVEDVKWISESKVAILESKSRYSLNPLALLSMFAGHTSLVYTYYVEVLNVESQNTGSRTKIVGGVQDSVACFGWNKWTHDENVSIKP